MFVQDLSELVFLGWNRSTLSYAEQFILNLDGEVMYHNYFLIELNDSNQRQTKFTLQPQTKEKILSGYIQTRLC